MLKKKKLNYRSTYFASEKSLYYELKKKLLPLKILKKFWWLQTLSNRGIVLREIDNTRFFETATDISDYLKEYKVVRKKLSKAAMETLSIIAYFQPITKPEIEEIRGVQLIRNFEILFNNEWIISKGRKEVPGRPQLGIQQEI